MRINPDLLDEHLRDKCRWPLLGVSPRFVLERAQRRADHQCKVLDMGEEGAASIRTEKLKRELAELDAQIEELKRST